MPHGPMNIKNGNLHSLTKAGWHHCATLPLDQQADISTSVSTHSQVRVSSCCSKRPVCHECSRNVTVECSLFPFCIRKSPVPNPDTKSCCVWLLCVSWHKWWAGRSFHKRHSRFLLLFFPRFIIHWTPCHSSLYNQYSWPIIYTSQIHFNNIRLSTCR